MSTNEVSPELNELSRMVIGAAIEVHRALGPGLLESVYENALCIELNEINLPFLRQHRVPLLYKGHDVGSGRLDLLVADQLIVEAKAVERIEPVHEAQILSYLRTTGRPLGLLVNFNVPRLRDGIRRFTNTRQ